MYRQPAVLDDDEIYLPAAQLGMGWWDDAWKEVKSVAKRVQKNPVVRGLEKRAVEAGTSALRGAAETGVAGAADAALTALGMPELAPAADKLIDKGAAALQKKGTAYLEQQIDASGRGIRYMSPAGGGLRTAGMQSQVGVGLRLSGQGHERQHCGGALRIAGSGLYVPAGVHGLVQGSGQACA